MSTAFDRQHVRLVHYVHPTENRFLGDDSEAEVIDINRRRSAHTESFEIRTMQDIRLRSLAEQQLVKDSKWWRVALRTLGLRF